MTRVATGRHHVEYVMGMAVTIDIRDPDIPGEAIDDVVSWLHHVDSTFSTYDSSSPISAVGRGDISPSDAGGEIVEVLRLCESIRIESHGVFDVFEVPAPNGTRLDPSGLVKGWAIERAAGLLEGYGCRNFAVNAGGDIVVRGRPSDDARWRIGIRHPEIGDALALVVEASESLAVATSATYERGAHIVDPRTGYPAIRLASATVVGPDLAIADAYATTVFVMGEAGLEWIELRPDYEAYIILHDDTTRWTSGFDRYRSQPATTTADR